jgi:hypothetical protein
MQFRTSECSVIAVAIQEKTPILSVFAVMQLFLGALMNTAISPF